MNWVLVALATLTGLLTGIVFGFFDVPIPAPPSLAGVMGIVGIFLGYRLMSYLGYGFDLLDALGL
ncbi:MAG: XapX domain-containing protein [Halorhabdus sp.]